MGHSRLNKKKAEQLSIPPKLKNWLKHIINHNIEFSMLSHKIAFHVSVRNTQEQDDTVPPQDDTLFINVGAGGFCHRNWINVDKTSDFYKKRQGPNTVNWDLLSLTPLPFPNNSIDFIYTSHVIEHVSDEAVDNFLLQSYLKLKVGGGIRIVCPDMQYLSTLYRRGDKTVFFPIRDYGEINHITSCEYVSLPVIEDASIQQLFLWAFARQASICHDKATKPLTDEEVDDLFSSKPLEEAFDICVQRCSISVQEERPEEHINWWTESKITQYLNKVGFNTVLKSRRSQSIFPEMRDPHYFDTNSPHVSLYIEAIREDL